MKAWIVLATWFCCAIILGSARISPLRKDEHKLGFPLVTFTTTGATPDDYSVFLSSLRNQLKSGKESYSIPLLPKETEVPRDKRFVYVKISNSEKKADITLAVDVVNVYVMGYQAGDQSYFFADISTTGYTDLFPGTVKTKFRFNGSYPALASFGAPRENVDLGLLPLENAIFSLNKYSPDPSKIAAPLVVAIQMISEAARLSHIERKIMSNFYERFRPLGDIISLENKWSDLSFAIQESVDGVFKEPVQLQKSDYSFFYVANVKQIKPYISLLLFDNEASIAQVVVWQVAENMIQKWESVL